MSKVEDFLSTKSMVTIFGDTYKLSEHFTPEDFVEAEDSVFVKLEALTRVVRVLYDVLSIDTQLVHANDIEKAAAVNVRYTIVHKKSQDKIVAIDDLVDAKTCSALADCTTKNRPKGEPGKYLVCMAETRAKSRVLRDLLGVPACSVEEVSSVTDLNNVVSFEGVIEPSQKVLIERKFMSEKGKTLKDVSEVLGKPVEILDALTKEEASIVISTFNKQK